MPLQGNPAGAVLGSPLAKQNATDKKGTHYDFNGIGGYFGVPVLADLYTIPCDPNRLNEDGFSSGQRRLAMRVRIMTGTARGKEYVLDVANYENLSAANQLAALCDNANFVLQPQVSATPGADLTMITGDVTFSGTVAAVTPKSINSAKISDDLKSPAANAEGLRRLGTGSNEAAPGTALAGKVDKVAGYGLSQQNFTPAEKNKLGVLPTNPVQQIVLNGTPVPVDSSGSVALEVQVGGEINTASNVGSSSAYNIFKGKSGVDLAFHKLLAGAGIALSFDNADNLIIAVTGATGGGTNTTPPAPYFLAYDDVANTYSFTPNGFSATEYVYVILGAAPLPCTSNIINVGDIALAPGQLEIYVPAGTGRNRGLPLYNAQTYTPAAAVNITPTAPTFTGYNDTTNEVYLSHPSYLVSELLYDLPNGAGSGLVPEPTGRIQVGNVAGQVVGYVKSGTGRNQGVKAYSSAFTLTVVPVTYGNTLSINNAIADGMSFVVQGAETLEFDSLSPSPSGSIISVVITQGGFTAYLDYNSEFGGKPFRFTDRQGTPHTGALPTSDTTISY